MKKPLSDEVTENIEPVEASDALADYGDAISDLESIDANLKGEPDPHEPEKEHEDDELDPEMAVGLIEMGLLMSEGYIAKSSGLAFEFDDDAKEKFLASCAPLVQKYGLTWLGIFEKYKVEIMFGTATVGLGLTSYKQLKKLNHEQQLELAKKEEAANDEKENARAATAATA